MDKKKEQEVTLDKKDKEREQRRRNKDVRRRTRSKKSGQKMVSRQTL